jgi:hypothetical protein
VPDIPLLQPLAFRSVVEKFTAPESLEMLSRIPKTPWPFPTIQWEIIRGSRAIARPNVPNSEAHIVPRLGRETVSGSFLYLREKKVFQPTTLYWIRQAASNVGDLTIQNRAEQMILREVNDLNVRFDNFAEYSIWQALQGRLVVDSADVQVDVDYKFLNSHKPVTGTPWAQATPEQIIGDVISFKRLIQKDGRVAAVDAYTSEKAIQDIFNSFAFRSSGTAGSLPAAGLLSDRAKDEYYRSGTLPGFMGLNWKPQEAVYDATGAAYTANPTDPNQEAKFLPENKLILANLTDNRPFEMFVGPTADTENTQGSTGKFAKNWEEKDPSGRVYLLEWNFIPAITAPEQIVSATIG